MAKYKIFIDVSNQIRDENKTNFIIDANCSLIEHLDLGWREGDIDFIEPNALRNFISLKSLDLKNNLIKSIDHECFENLTNLEELNLSGNYLKKLPVNFFSTMHKLKCLNLDGNILNGDFDFRQLTSLEELSIEINQKQNPVEVLKMLESLKSLKKLCFKWSIDEDEDEEKNDDQKETSSFPNREKQEQSPVSDFFKGLSNLEELCLFGFENYKLFETDCFKHFHNLKLLKLENCLISCIKTNLFIGLNNLNELELVSNQIDTIEEKAFEKLSNLNMLDISYNKLRELKKNHFVGLNSLKFLIISDNSIESIEDDTFNHLSDLKEINLSNNKLDEINENWFKDLKNLEKKQIECENECKSKKHFIGNMAKKKALEKMATKKGFKNKKLNNKKRKSNTNEDSDTEDIARAIFALLHRNKYDYDVDDDNYFGDEFGAYEYKTYGSGGWRVNSLIYFFFHEIKIHFLCLKRFHILLQIAMMMNIINLYFQKL